MLEDYINQYTQIKNIIINILDGGYINTSQNTTTNETNEEPPTTISTILELEHNKISNEEAILITKEILNLNQQFPFNLIHQPEYIKYNELEFFNSNSGSEYPTLFSKINKTQTHLGRFQLMNLLLHPITNRETLEKRQSILKYFENETILYDTIIEKIKNLKKLENEVLWFFKTRTPEMNKVLEIVYFQNWWSSFLNLKEQFLHYYYTFIMLISPVYGALAPLTFFIFPYIAIYFIYGNWIPMSSYITLIKTLFFSGGGFFSVFAKMYSMFSNGATSKILNFFSTSSFVKYAYYIIAFGTYLYGIYISITNSLSYYKIISFIHNKLNVLAKFTKLIKNIHSSIDPKINENLGFKTLEISNEFEILWNSEILEENCITTHRGIILSTFWKIKDKCKTEFDGWMRYIGLLDAWISNASLLIKTKHSSTTPMTIPNYIWNTSTSKPTPTIEIQDFWNLLTVISDSTEPILNSIVLGGENEKPNNAIITSPNASGKSTCMKSIIEVIIMAQTIGIIPARNCRLTPFTQINTYLNIPDTQGKESLFQAEMSRCASQISKLKILKPTEYAFTIMDEIFTSTNHDEGVSGSYAIIRKMARFTNSICMVSTHFKIIGSIFGKNPQFISLHLPITISSDSNDKNKNKNKIINKSYKLVEGTPTHPQIAIELLNLKGFDTDIISDARKMFKKLNQCKPQRKSIAKK
jgi:hypothetical protein